MIFKPDSIVMGDCLAVMAEMPDCSADMIFADPPYNLSRSRFKMKFVKSGGKDLDTDKGEWDRFETFEDYSRFTSAWLTECRRILKDGGSLWVAGTYHGIYAAGYLAQSLGFDILNEVIYHKLDATPNMSCTRFVADHENFIWARKGGRHRFNYDLMRRLNGGKQMRSIWPAGKCLGGRKAHPTQKPEWLLERIILACTAEGDLVFDPFLGSGTTAVAAKRLGRRFFGCELRSEYFEMAVRRLDGTKSPCSSNGAR